jgi:glutathione S-transferase
VAAEVTARPRLLTIPLSHYCEKARWALDAVGLDYVEEPHLPLVHRYYTGRVGARQVPVLITPEQVHRDSGAIVRYADSLAARYRPLIPQDAGGRSEVLEMERYLDRELGPHARRWAYGELLGMPALRPCFAAGVSSVERAIAPVVTIAVQPLIRRGFRVTPENARRSLERVREVFAWIDAKLADGRAFLVGDAFGAADITFASLASPVLLPDGFGGTLPPYEAAPATMREEVERFRATAAGRHALAMYARHRRIA